MYKSPVSPICQGQRCYYIRLYKGALKFHNRLEDYSCRKFGHHKYATLMSWMTAQQKCAQDSAHLFQSIAMKR